MRRESALLSLFLVLGCAEKKTGALPDAGQSPNDATTTDTPEVVEFTASSNAIQRGGTVELRWRVTGARLVTVFSATEVLTTTDQLEGTVVTLPIQRRSTFTIRALGDGPAVGATVDVDVIWPEPVITLFESDPPVSFINGYVTLRWRTESVVKVSVREGLELLPNGVFMNAAASSGAISVYISRQFNSFTLEAENPTGIVTQEISVETGDPPYLRIAVSPRTIVDASTVALSWDSFGFSRLELSTGMIVVPTVLEGDVGQLIIPVDRNTEFYVNGLLGEFPYIQAYASVSFAATEAEPNDGPATSQYITYESGVRGEISTADDVDFYTYDNYVSSNFRIRTRNVGSGCDTDTSIDVIEFTGTGTTVAFDADDGIPTGRGGACGEIAPERDPWAIMPVFGTYYIVVRGQRGETGPYFLTIEPEL